MVSYSFRARFAAPIENETKLHTLRGPRRRHARVDEELQLYVGMRTKACRLIARKTCSQVLGVMLDFRWQSSSPVQLYEVAELVPGEPRQVGPLTPVRSRAFARADGFSNMERLARFWWSTHATSRWSGFLIGWGPAYLKPSEAKPATADVVAPLKPPPWSAEPWAWRPASVAEAIEAGAWSAEGQRRYRSRLDRRVVSTVTEAGAQPVYHVCEAPGYDLAVTHASFDDIAEVILRLDRDAAATREWEAA